MPLLNHPTLGDAQGCEYLQGIIQTIHKPTDTCTVSVGGDTVAALIYFH